MSSNFENIDDLLGKYLAGEASEKELQLVKEWLDKDEANRHYFKQLETIFDRAASVKELQQFDTDAAWNKVKANLKNGRANAVPVRAMKSYALWYRIAAGFILLAGIAWFLFRNDGNSLKAPIEVVADRTSISDTLPDGSDVFLNKKTKVVYAYVKSTKTHEVKLQGEAYFNIKNAARENFVVDAGGVFIKDIGTSFNVKAYPDSDEVEVLVEEGEIVFYTKDNPGIHLRQSGKGVYNRATGDFKIEAPDPNITSYKTKFFVFKATDLNTMVQELNSVYEKKIIIPDHLKACSLTVSFRDEDIDEIAAIIAETLGLTLRSENGTIILEGKGCE